MSRTVGALTLGLALARVVSAATPYNLDPTHTAVQFAVRHLMVSTVRGEFGKLQGRVMVDPADWTRSTISATIDAASINTRVEKRDEHLRSPDFLDVAKYPTITFTSTKVVKVANDKYRVTGDLTLHGVTKSVDLDVEGPTPPRKDPWGNVRSGATATATINRKDFGIVWNKALDGGGVTVGDEIKVTIDVEALAAAE